MRARRTTRLHGQGNMGGGGLVAPSPISNSTVDAQMGAYDSLPPIVREAVRDAFYPWNAVQLLRAIDDGVPVDAVVMALRAGDYQMRRSFELQRPAVLAAAAETFKNLRLPPRRITPGRKLSARR